MSGDRRSSANLTRGIVGGVIGFVLGVAAIPIFVYFTDGPEYMYSFAAFIGYGPTPAVAAIIGFYVGAENT